MHAADRLEGVDAQQLKKASTHSLRHCIPHPTMYVEHLGAQRSRDDIGVPDTERESRLAAMRGFWGELKLTS